MRQFSLSTFILLYSPQILIFLFRILLPPIETENSNTDYFFFQFQCVFQPRSCFFSSFASGRKPFLNVIAELIAYFPCLQTFIINKPCNILMSPKTYDISSGTRWQGLEETVESGQPLGDCLESKGNAVATWSNRAPYAATRSLTKFI